MKKDLPKIKAAKLEPIDYAFLFFMLVVCPTITLTLFYIINGR